MAAEPFPTEHCGSPASGIHEHKRNLYTNSARCFRDLRALRSRNRGSRLWPHMGDCHSNLNGGQAQKCATLQQITHLPAKPGSDMPGARRRPGQVGQATQGGLIPTQPKANGPGQEGTAPGTRCPHDSRPKSQPASHSSQPQPSQQPASSSQPACEVMDICTPPIKICLT